MAEIVILPVDSLRCLWLSLKNRKAQRYKRWAARKEVSAMPPP